MTDDHAHPSALRLPEGWCELDPGHATGLVKRLAFEIASGHILAGIALQAVAVRAANDDVLYRHVADHARFTVVHLTWASQRETTPHFPAIEFDGSFAAFLEHESRLAAEQDR
jgi:hypothetical protein